MKDDGESLSDSYIKITTNFNENDDFVMCEKNPFNKILYEKICCIELINNNKIYIKYELDWTIKDVT
jgi:hypothetical protein